MKPKSERKNIVVIGGGTGIHPLLRGLKDYWGDYNTTAIVSMADSGGSNARIRDEFGMLPVSDVNRGLAALATDIEGREQLVRELFLYRFDKGDGLSGHNFGNLLLIALTELLGSEKEAIKVASRILRIRGTVLPVTTDHIDIVAEFEDRATVVGEHEIDEPEADRIGKRITHFFADPAGVITDEARDALLEADLIVLGPGDLYSSLLANIVVSGVPEAIQSAKAPFVFVSNLMSRPGQTDGMSACEHVEEVVKYVGREPDTVVVNTSAVPKHLLERYAEKDQFPVADDTDKLSCHVVKAELLSNEEVVKAQGDILQRSLVRGDEDKMAKVIIDLVP